MYKFLILNFIKVSLSGIKNVISTKKGFFFIGIFLWILLEFFIGLTFGVVFNYLVNYFPGGYIFTPKIFAIIIMSVFNVTVFMSVVAAIPTLYKNSEINFLFVNPVNHKDIFIYGLFKIFFYSLWGSIIILIPCFIAYGVVNKLNIFYYIFSIFVVLLLSLIASNIGTFIVLLFTRRVLAMKTIIIKIIFIFVFAISVSNALMKIPLFTLQNEETGLSIFESYIVNYDYSNLFLPYNRFSKLVEYTSQGDLVGIFSYFFFIILSLIVFFHLITFLGGSWYFESVKNFEKFSFFKRKNRLKFNSIFGKNKYINLIKKDILVHIKDPVQRSQMIIFFILLLIYVLTLKGTTIRELNNIFIVSMVSSAAIGITGFFVSAISLRFVFPNISLEGRSFWILKTVPISQTVFYILKLLFFGFISLAISICLIFSYINIIGIRYQVSSVIYSLIAPVTLFVVSVFFVFGSIFPDFKETNPSKISTSLPGFMGIFFSNMLIFIVSFSLFPDFSHFYQSVIRCNFLGYDIFISKIIIIRLTITIIIYIILSYGLKTFKKTQF